MRAAPAGVCPPADGAFAFGVETAALTHGHPSGFLTAGYLATAVEQLLAGSDRAQALGAADRELRRWDGTKRPLTTEWFHDAVVLAVNHGGDSDSTGAIAGNLAGALYGEDHIPSDCLQQLQLCNEIATIAAWLTHRRLDAAAIPGRDAVSVNAAAAERQAILELFNSVPPPRVFPTRIFGQARQPIGAGPTVTSRCGLGPYNYANALARGD